MSSLTQLLKELPLEKIKNSEEFFAIYEILKSVFEEKGKNNNSNEVLSE